MEVCNPDTDNQDKVVLMVKDLEAVVGAAILDADLGATVKARHHIEANGMSRKMDRKRRKVSLKMAPWPKDSAADHLGEAAMEVEIIVEVEVEAEVMVEGEVEGMEEMGTVGCLREEAAMVQCLQEVDSDEEIRAKIFQTVGLKS